MNKPLTPAQEVARARVLAYGSNVVALATVFEDFGIVPASEAWDIAQEEADRLSVMVCIRDANSDGLLANVFPN